MPEGLEYQRVIGLTEENIQLRSATLRDKGSALHQAGVSPVVTRLLNSLHTGAWCRLGGDEHILSTRRGGRQGCLHGPSNFNMGYAVALSHVRQKLMSLNMCSGVRLYDNLPFLVSSSAKFFPSAGNTKIPSGSFTSDVTFVDVQAFLMSATTPSGLKRVITNTLETVTSVFRAHGLNINFKQGKTELVVNFLGSSRGKSKHRAEIQELHNTFPLPAHATARAIHVVPHYKRRHTCSCAICDECVFSHCHHCVWKSQQVVGAGQTVARPLPCVFSPVSRFQGTHAWSAVSLWCLSGS